MIRLYNTLTHKIEDLKPLRKVVGLYTCGPTVYNYAHLGNLRTFVFEDLLKRSFIYNGLKVKHIVNITDVGHLTSDADTGEDKMEKGAAREGKSAWESADFYTEAFFKDLKALNILSATKYPKATDHIKEQIALIEKLEQKGFTYQTKDGIYFDTSKLSDYGKLANLKNQSLEAGTRVEMGDKKHPTDFALWKFSPNDKKRQMEWLSPWGMGFPGWHVECSAMAVKYLGQPFDIHAGGIDHVPVHHTNEIAQSEAAEGKPLANIWMHGEFLLIGSDKMAKSGGNFITLQTLIEHGISPLAYRYFLLQTHYRKQLTFSWEALEAAQTGLNHLYNTVRSWPGTSKIGCAEYEEKFLKATNNDLNIPEALALAWKLVKDDKLPPSAKKESLFKFDEVLGLEIKKNLKVKIEKNPAEIKKLIAERDAARKNKNWTESDRLRTELEKQGYSVEDSKDETRVTKK